MASRDRDRQLTDDEIEAVRAAADGLGARLLEALADATGRDPDAFAADPDDDFPASDP